jgi:glycosyltransferase involved in cell wall biosynthesis
MKISIAIATYNGQDFILEQLQSLVSQTIRPDEIIISDDNSTDDTVDLIEKFSVGAPVLIKVYKNKKRLNYARNFNEALKRTTGDLVFLCDQDDFWFPEKIETICELAGRYKEFQVFMNDAILADLNLNPTNLTKFNQIISSGLGKESFVMGCCAAVRRDFLDFVLPIPSELSSHDNWIVEIADGMKLKYFDARPLQLYRRHDGNTSQFIGNYTFKVNSLFRRLVGLLNALNPKSKIIFRQRVHQKEIMLANLYNISRTVPNAWTKQFFDFIELKEIEFGLMRRRLKIHDYNLLCRIIYACKFYRGVYPKNSKLDFFVRDIIG